MGRYYARHDGESEAVADAIAEHYQPRFAGKALQAEHTPVDEPLAHLSGRARGGKRRVLTLCHQSNHRNRMGHADACR